MHGLTRRQFLPAALAVGLGGALLPLDRVFGAGSPVRVRLGTLAPRGSSYYKHLQVMGEKWRHAPGGGVSLTIYPDGTMGSEADMVRRMRIGQLQAAMITVGGLAEIDPAVAGLQKMPLIYRSLDEVVYIREKLGPLLEQRFQAKGFHLLCWADAGWVRFFSKEPALRPADFKGLKMFVWAGDPDHVQLMREEGYRPVPLEYTDTLTGLQTGLIEVVPSTPFYALAGQFYRVTTHMVEVNWAPLVGGTLITRKAWDALAPETQAALSAAALDMGAEVQARGRQENQEALAAMQKRGLTVHRLAPDIQAEWEAFGASIEPKVRGRMVPTDIFDEVQRLLREYRAGQR